MKKENNISQQIRTDNFNKKNYFCVIDNNYGAAKHDYIESVNSNGWINWGRDNAYPEYLLSLLDKSPIHSSIINLKATMIGRNGFIDANWDEDMIRFINNRQSGEDLEEINSKISWDLAIFGGYYLMISWTKQRDKIAAISHIPVKNVRIAKPEYRDYLGNDAYFICDNWKGYNKKPTLVAGYSYENRDEATQIFYVKEGKPQNNYYPIPDYIAGINVIETDYLINEYHLANIQDGFSPAMHINFPYIPQSDKEFEENADNMRRDYLGVRKKKTIITYAEDATKKPTFEPIETNGSDTKYIELQKGHIDAIVYTHQLSSRKLIAVEVSGDSHKNELLEALRMYQSVYIGAKQKLIEKNWNKLARVNRLQDKIKLETFDINLTPDVPVSDIISVLTNEVLSDKQKTQILVDKGYTRDRALLLVEKGTQDTQTGNTPSTEKIN